ncbi:MAG: J domain-containing protein [Clostridiales bacterium]|nr:J domain-containing protein [Clostridiales bacterium]
MRTPDYYKTLGVQDTASDEEIKKAFRKLAKKYHPDTHGGDKASEERFKLISEAYEVLGDKKRRQEYDELRRNPPPPSFDPSGFGARTHRSARTVTFDEGGDFSDFFEMFFGRGRGAGADPFSHNRAVSMPGQDVEAEIAITVAEGFEGAKKAVSLELDGGRRTLNFSIPPGTTDGARIKLRGQGGPGMGGGPAGDLYLKVRVSDTRYTLDGLDLTEELRLMPWDAALGAQVPFETPDGQIMVRVPGGVQTGQRIRIAGRGYKNKKGERGDLYARVALMNPSSLTAEQRRLYEQLQKIAGPHGGN